MTKSAMLKVLSKAKQSWQHNFAYDSDVVDVALTERQKQAIYKKVENADLPFGEAIDFAYGCIWDEMRNTDFGDIG